MITVKDLTFWYSTQNRVFDKLDLELDAGHIYGLLGKNGAGKTTLLKLICGLSFPKIRDRGCRWDDSLETGNGLFS